MRILLQGGTIINEGRTFKGDLLIHNDRIEKIIEGELDSVPGDIKVIDATGKYVIPGVIDDQVHFREPGLTHKGDIREGSRAAAAGGVTSFMDMPNVKPPTVTNELLREKQQIAKENAAVNYSFYLGATVDNIDEIKKVDPHTTCGIKIFVSHFAFVIAVHRVCIICLKDSKVKQIRTCTDFFVRRKPDPDIPVWCTFCNQFFHGCHDFSNTCLVISAQKCGTVCRDQGSSF